MTIDLIEFEEKYGDDFRCLNLEWLEKFNFTESHDLAILNDPKKMVLDNGGFIYLALHEQKIIGSAALINEGDSVYELAKMSVDPLFRGRGIGKLLLDRCFEKAKEIGAKKLILFSNTKLQTALNLYTRFGFKHVPVVDAPFVTADVKMEFQF